VLCSPLRRALETCEIAGYRAQAELDEDLREWNYGDYEGLTTPEILVSDPSWDLWRDGSPGGERPAEVSARADRVIRRLSDAGVDTLAFAHGHILRVLAARWLEMDVTAGSRFALSAGAVSLLGHERETRVIDGWNLTAGG
jgi:probable phosphoglycerate mutase